MPITEYQPYLLAVAAFWWNVDVGISLISLFQIIKARLYVAAAC